MASTFPIAITSKAKQLAEKACTFLTGSTDPFHAVHHSIILLEASGFVRVPGGAASLCAASIRPGGKYYYTVQNSTLVAFSVGTHFTPAHGAFHIIGGHTDSPNLRVKPKSQTRKGGGSAAAATTQLAVECYGGGLWHTWFDRDLSISGKVLVRASANESNGTNATIQQRLVQLKDPIARVSTLCIHLQSASEREAFAVNKEDHTSPILASLTANPNYVNKDAAALEQSVVKQMQGSSGDSTSASASSNDAWRNGQEPLLLTRLAHEMGIGVQQIADFDLSLYDTQPATVGGLLGEFLYSARLDNLATVFTAVTALTLHDNQNDADVAMVVCFDHEEVGSVSSHGAGSPVVHDAVTLTSAALGNTTASQHATSIASSFILSIDQAHAIHPNYASKHDAQHAPVMNGGVVIKTNSNQRYTTNSLTGFIVRELGRRAAVPIQEFCVRNDCPCGSTIGPTLSALTGIRTVDAGMPQLSMHSCREVMGVQDLQHGLDLFNAFFTHFRSVDEGIDVAVS